MFQIDGPNTVGSMPARTGLGAPGWFKQVTGGPDGQGTRLQAEWLNMLQAEVLALLAAGGISPNKATDTQILAAVQQVATAMANAAGATSRNDTSHNFARSGLGISSVSGLQVTFAAGVGYADGSRVNKAAPFAVTVGNNATTDVWLDSAGATSTTTDGLQQPAKLHLARVYASGGTATPYAMPARRRIDRSSVVAGARLVTAFKTDYYKAAGIAGRTHFVGAILRAPGDGINWYFAFCGARLLLRRYPAEIKAFLQLAIKLCAAPRANSGAYTVGTMVVAGGAIRESESNATTAGSPPTWGTNTVGGTVVDGGVTWRTRFVLVGGASAHVWTWVDWAADLATALKADSNDSYGATFVSLLAEYLRFTGDLAWLDEASPHPGYTWRQCAMAILYNNVALETSSGLVRVYQAGVAPDGAANNTRYAMDAAECEKACRDGAYIAGEYGDSANVSYYTTMAGDIAAGIGGLYHAGSGHYRYHLGGDGAAEDGVAAPAFYPTIMCQALIQQSAQSEANLEAALQWSHAKMADWWALAHRDPLPTLWCVYVLVERHRRPDIAQLAVQAAMEAHALVAPKVRLTIDSLGALAGLLDMLATRTTGAYLIGREARISPPDSAPFTFTAMRRLPPVDVTPVGGGNPDVTHNLGTRPLVFARARCTTAEGNFSIGDRVDLDHGYAELSSQTYGFVIKHTNDNAVRVLFAAGNAGKTLIAIDQTSRTRIALSDANWKLELIMVG